MGRPSIIPVDRTALLQRIASIIDDRLYALNRIIDHDPDQGKPAGDMSVYHARLERDKLLDIGTKYDLAKFSDLPLRPSVRTKLQATLRAMEADGLIAMVGTHATHVRVTDAGRAFLAQQTDQTPHVVSEAPGARETP